MSVLSFGLEGMNVSLTIAVFGHPFYKIRAK